MSARSRAYSSPSKRPFVIRAVVFLVVLLLVLLLASRLESKTWYITADGAGDAPTIQAGVDSAAAGDTVLAGPGIFSDTTHVRVGTETKAVCVHVYKSVVLKGSGPVMTTLGSSAADFVVYAGPAGGGAVIRDFKVTTDSGGYFCLDAVGSSGALEKCGVRCESSVVSIVGNEIYANDMGVHLVGSSADLANNEIHQSVRAIVLEKSSDASIQNNHIHDCAGFLECADSSPLIVDNLMNEACEGLWFWSGCSPQISGNRITGVRNFQAIAICSHSGATIENNWIAGVDYGIRLYEKWSAGRVVRGNTILGTEEAVYVHPPNVVVENNTIDWTLVGIYFASGATYLIRNNIITRAVWGISADGADPPVISCNDVFDASALYYGIPDQTGINGNIAVDPEYCGIDGSGNYYLQSDSPCAPGSHPDGRDCGLIGALPINCGKVGGEKKTWGVIKEKYRARSEN